MARNVWSRTGRAAVDAGRLTGDEASAIAAAIHDEGRLARFSNDGKAAPSTRNCDRQRLRRELVDDALTACRVIGDALPALVVDVGSGNGSPGIPLALWYGRPVTLLESVARIRRQSEIPIVLMSYINPIHRFGLQRFPSAARDVGVDGLIVSDCPPEEMGELQIALEGAGVHPILLIAPTSPPRRISLISAKSRGYIYYVSLRGVTGPRDQLPDDLAAGIRRVRALTDKPLAVGFGISTPAQARAVSELADAVIVGSAVVATVEQSLGTPHLTARVGDFVGGLRAAVA